MEKRTISTKLVNREEIFKILAVGEATGFPVLLVGPPGTGKTRALLDYAKARFSSFNETMEKTFILETDEGTRGTEIKGRVDVKKLVTEKQYSVIAPIVGAELIMINEIDKASAGLRNSLLSVMNEKFLFNGQEKVKCQWKSFVASCNVIPEDEVNGPFWDRFVLKSKLERITKAQIMGYYKLQQSGIPAKSIVINVPNGKDINALNLDINKLNKFIDVCYSALSDRTLSYVPSIVGAVSLVYNFSINKSMIKACDILLGQDKAKELSKILEPKEITDIRGEIELIGTIRDYDIITSSISQIENRITNVVNTGIINQEDIKELVDELNYVLSQNLTYTSGNAVDIDL